MAYAPHEAGSALPATLGLSSLEALGKAMAKGAQGKKWYQAAAGFGRAEGGGMVVLKRLSDAIAAGDRIHAVILGSATNHSGRTNGITAPSQVAQQAVIRQALKVSRISAAHVSYIETHGTGTVLGDPIEAAALGQVFGSGDRPPDHPLVLGALKTNIGHAEAAAGIAGLIKAVLALEHRQIPANLHLTTPNPHIDWESLPFQLPTTAIPWPSAASPLTVGVSAFGFNGTNAHVILQEPPSATLSPHSSHVAASAQAPYLLPLSARTPVALTQLVARYAQHLAAQADLNLADVCFTASVGRSHFPHRLAVIATSTAELRAILIDFLSGRAHPAYWKSDDLQSLEDHRPSAPHSESYSELDFSEALELQAKCYIQGETIDWQALYRHRSSQPKNLCQFHKLTLPTYPVQRQRYRLEIG
jgi:acyl transferase domain-containing protein